jgi:hypothetical protein
MILEALWLIKKSAAEVHLNFGTSFHQNSNFNNKPRAIKG